jgi:hypothetical protein
VGVYDKLGPVVKFVKCDDLRAVGVSAQKFERPKFLEVHSRIIAKLSEASDYEEGLRCYVEDFFQRRVTFVRS